MNTSQLYRITSTYVRTNRNFAILNLPDPPGEESALQRTAKICNNILCRGYVVNPSTFLRNEFWGSDEIEQHLQNGSRSENLVISKTNCYSPLG